MTIRNWTLDTYRNAELARISLEAAQDAVRGAEDALRAANQLHELSVDVLADDELSDEDAIEAMADEGVDYDTAEAIVRNDRHNGHTVRSVRELTGAELKEESESGKLGERSQNLVNRELEQRHHNAMAALYA